MKKVISLFAVLMLMAVATTGFAQVRAGSVNITPTIGMYKFEGSEDMKDSIALGIRAGYNFNKYFGIEGFVHYVPTELVYPNSQDNEKMKFFGYGIEGIVNILPNKVLVPFVAAGIGGAHYTNGNDDSVGDRYNKLTLDYGAGVKWFLNDWFALRADVRHIIPVNGHQNNLLATVGATFAFGGAKDVVAPEPAPTPAPAPAPAPEIIEKGRTTLKVLFDFDKAVIKKHSLQDVDNLVGVMKRYPELNVTIEGHTDSIGTAAYNKKLSQRRADAVKNNMIGKGIDSKRLNSVGYGFDKPIASNKTKEGRAQNRRVEAVADYLIKK